MKYLTVLLLLTTVWLSGCYENRTKPIGNAEIMRRAKVCLDADFNWKAIEGDFGRAIDVECIPK